MKPLKGRVSNRGVKGSLLQWLRTLAAFALGTSLASAVGYRLPNQDPEAIARGNAFVATADNPSAIYYNPAGITQLEGNNIRAGVYFVSAGVDFESPAGTAKKDTDFKPVPQLYYAFAPTNFPLAFGLGLYAPYGLSLDWGQNTPFSTIAQKGQLTYLSINPVIAWKITPTLSIGIGPTFNYSDADFERVIQSPFPTLIPNGQYKITGNGWGYGFNAGARWQPCEQWAFGVNYRYATDVDYSGTEDANLAPVFSSSVPATASIHFPQFVVGGVSFRPTDKWNLEFNLDWTDWNSVKQIPINGAFPNSALVLNYRSSFMYEVGATRQLGKGYFLSLGFFYSENSSPDHDFNPIIPDSNLYLGSIGFGYHCKRWDWAAAYHFGYNPSRDVTGDVTYPQANGTYHTLNHAFNLAATFKF